jgi:hypothetical protein
VDNYGAFQKIRLDISIRREIAFAEASRSCKVSTAPKVF